LKIKNINDLKLEKTLKEIEDEIINIVKFVFYIEHQRFFRFPDPVETNTGQLDNFNYGDIDPLIKEVLVNNNLENFIQFAKYKYEQEDYIKAIEVLKTISEVNSDIYDVWYYLGQSYGSIGKRKESNKCFRKANELIH
jgi:tetratricopeptide (TPR) repeat protein